MFSSPFFRRLFLPCLLLICAAVGTVGIFAAKQMKETYLARTEPDLVDRSRLVELMINQPVKDGDVAAVQQLLAEMHRPGGTRVTLIDATGVVIADNEADPHVMENHLGRPEIQAAMKDREHQAFTIRKSATLGQELCYFAKQIEVGPAPSPKIYYLRLAEHLSDLDAQLHHFYGYLALAAVLAAVAMGGISYALIRRDTRPVIALTDFANTLARGELNRRYSNPEHGETAVLAKALNDMADSLESQLQDTAEGNARLLAIMGSMNEGVIAADTDARILFTNESAGRLLGFSAALRSVTGLPLAEVVRIGEINHLVEQVLSGGNGSPNDSHAGVLRRKTIHVSPLSDRHLEVTVCTFPIKGPPEGLILVAHDTTQSEQFQKLRKEFVANVSHELRTPLSIIKGFAETLRDGALEDPVRAPQFLATIEKHADQLTNLVSDLLELSRLDSQVGLTRKAPVNIVHLIRRVEDLLLPVAQRKKHTLAIDVPEQLPAVFGNEDYLERAITNLVDNAIKYTPEGGRVSVKARQLGENVCIEVADNGIGIAQHEVAFIFERFYRVDRSRSRELGGTGLGLSIVKHVVQVHGGSIQVDTSPGQGSTFRLQLPVASTPAYAAVE
jgi:two-component system phosphate regulon sensor histidine kinase PhoR